MLCEICKKNEAVVHIQEIINGEKKTIHICQNCAAQKGLENIGFQGINIAEILYNLSTKNNLSLPENSKLLDTQNKKEKIQIKTCSECKWDSEKFQKTGKLGCENCYSTFSDIIEKMISNIQKGNLHIGKRLGEKTTEKNIIMMDIIKLQKKLEECVKKEEFEKAGILKNKINELKDRLIP